MQNGKNDDELGAGEAYLMMSSSRCVSQPTLKNSEDPGTLTVVTGDVAQVNGLGRVGVVVIPARRIAAILRAFHVGCHDHFAGGVTHAEVDFAGVECFTVRR